MSGHDEDPTETIEQNLQWTLMDILAKLVIFDYWDHLSDFSVKRNT
jgi:hypothetical protein